MTLREVTRTMVELIALMRRASLDAEVAEGLLPSSFASSSEDRELMRRFQVCTYEASTGGAPMLRRLPDMHVERLSAGPVL